MRRWVAAGLVLFVAAAFWLNRARHGDPHARHLVRHESDAACAACRQERRRATLEELRSVAYLERYITDVIDHGSKQNLGFKYGDMPAGMADKEASPKIAAYVVTLAGLKPTHPEWVQEGRTFYVSNCGGCHGEDGRGIHGTFPDLTRVPLPGIQKRIEEASLGR
ncbi:c-type cytochrome [Hydrogenimonas sp.]